jgi:hypothetical protein
MFNFDPGTARAEFEHNGYVHLRGVLEQSMIDTLTDFLEKAMRENIDEKGEWRIYGKKRQFLFEFPDSESAEKFRCGIAALTGIDHNDLTISERHLKVYDCNAAPWPAPHKDRAASQISIGLPVSIPEKSSTCVFPGLQPGPNPEEHAVFMTDKDHPDLDKIYQSEDCVMLHERPGDLVAFLGSSIYHERVHPADAAILYIKVNGAGSDPLGEDIYRATEAS